MGGKNEEQQEMLLYAGPLADKPSKPFDVSGQIIAPPSIGLAKEIVVAVLGGYRGRYHPSDHWRRRRVLRNFDVFDMLYVTQNGRCTEPPTYSLKHDNYKFSFCGDVDGIEFEAVFAISAKHHRIKSPLLILVTGCWKNKTGIRKRR